MDEESYTVPAPVVSASDARKMRIWRVDFTPRQLVESAVLTLLLLLLNALLDTLGGGLLGEAHLIIMLALIGGSIYYVFKPVNGRVGTAWLILTLRWYRHPERHIAYSRQSRAVRLLAIYREGNLPDAGEAIDTDRG